MSLDEDAREEFAFTMGKLVPKCGLPSCRNQSTKKVKECARCHRVAYCGKEHQTSDWQRHKPECKVEVGLDQRRAEMVRKVWRSHQVQQKVRLILQGGVRDCRAEMERSHAAAVKSRVEDEEVMRRKMTNHHIIMTSTADPNAGQPCMIPVAMLKPIGVGDLVPGKVHKGTVLWVEIIGDFSKIQGASTIVCDKDGECCAVSLYNFFDVKKSSLSCTKKLPMGTLLGIKEPYFKLSNGGGLLVRTDLPNNVEVRPGWDFIAPGDLKISPLELKCAGNEAFKRGDIQEACRSYTEALARVVAEPDKVLELALRSNRAQSFLASGMFFEAKGDAAAALVIDPSHIKSKRRLAFALDGLGRHTEALELIQTYQYTTSKADILQVQLRLQQSTGDYGDLRSLKGRADFIKMADFFGPIEVRTAGLKGRGLFLTRSVEAKELLFAERAFVTSTENGLGATTEYAGDALGGGNTNSASQEAAVGAALKRVCSRPIDNERLAYLCGGPLDKKIPQISLLKLVPSGNVAQCSSSHVRTIVSKNAFAYENAAHVGGELKQGTGLWVIASFMNHADMKDLTVHREFIGPMMFVFSHRNLPAGTELTTSYFKDSDKVERSKQYGF